MKKFTVEFYGVRGTYAVPGKKTLHYGGNTPCVAVKIDDHLIIIDAGTGIINLGNELIAQQKKEKKPIRAIVLLSHTHQDHIAGFPFFKPAYVGSSVIYLYGPKTSYQDLKDVLRNAMLSPYFPVDLDEMKSFKAIRNIAEAEVIIWSDALKEPKIRHVFRHPKIETQQPVIVSLFKSYSHPKDGVNVYKVRYGDKFIVYATDVEGYVGGDRRLINFTKGADVLIHDATYLNDEYLSDYATTQGWGHSTPDMAVEVAKLAGVKKLVLFHHNPDFDDEKIDAIQKEVKKKFPNSLYAYEGLKIEV